MKMKTRLAKRKTTQPVVSCAKKLLSKIPRWRRTQISPVLYSSLGSIVTDQNTSSISCSHFFAGEISCESSRVFDGETKSRKRHSAEIRSSGENEFRRVTRSYYKQKEAGERKGVIGDVEVEVSESSCVESCSGVFGERELNSKRSGGGGEYVKEIGEDEESDAITRSEISSVQQFLPECAISCAESSDAIFKSGGNIVGETENLPEFKAIEVVSISSGGESKLQNACSSVVEFSAIARNYVESNYNSNSVSTTPKFFEPDLTCTEEFSYEDFSDQSFSQETTTSQLEWDIFPGNSDLDMSSEYTPSIYFDSGSEFSERSVGDSYRSPTFSFFLDYRKQFCRSTSAFDVKVSSGLEDVNNDELNLSRFEDAEDEESYQCLRSRERRQVYLRDYAAEYGSTTDNGDLIVQQRLQMIHWMVEHSNAKDLQQETLFLGINLLDRFLSKGFFNNKRNLEIVGIACLTLATRIEENRPYNSVRQRTFYVGSIMYSRCEVVAMEWLVQEVLSFQCFLPSIYNFLWFYLKAARVSEEMEKSIKHLAMLAMLGPEQLNYWPSTVAASLVILVAGASNQNAAYHRVMETHVRTEDDDLHDCVKSLQGLLTYMS